MYLQCGHQVVEYNLITGFPFSLQMESPVSLKVRLPDDGAVSIDDDTEDESDAFALIPALTGSV